jgi:hypothetical protein
MHSRCSHLNFVLTDATNTAGCEECLASGDTWVHLRLCRTFEPGEDWSWCYIDELEMELG